MNEYRDIHASILKFAKDFADEKGIEVADLDAFASPQEWPEGDFIGPAEFMLDVDEHQVYVTVAFAVSTKDDPHMMRMSEYINDLLEKLMPTRKIFVYDAPTGTPRGRLIVQNGTRVGEITDTEAQPVKPVFVRMTSDQMMRLN